MAVAREKAGGLILVMRAASMRAFSRLVRVSSFGMLSRVVLRYTSLMFQPWSFIQRRPFMTPMIVAIVPDFGFDAA